MKNTIIGLGTAAIGRPEYINIKSNSPTLSLEEFKQQGKSVLEIAFQLGVRYFDTAPGYGLAEGLLIEWNNSNANREIEIGTKWGYTYVANFEKNATVHEVKEHSLAKLLEQWDTSKEMLNHLSYYQIHSAGYDTDVLTDTAIHEKLHQIKKETNIKIGITTTGDSQTQVIQTAMDILVKGESLFDTFQVTYNVLDQSLNSIIDKLKTLNKVVIVKEALANGRLFRNVNYPQYNALYDLLESLSKKHKVGVDAIALRYVMDGLSPDVVLSGASTKLQLEQNLKANTFILSQEEINLLSQFKVEPEIYWQERKKLLWH